MLVSQAATLGIGDKVFSYRDSTLILLYTIKLYLSTLNSER